VDEAARQGSEAVGTRDGDEPTEAELRRDIAATREDLGETVAALVEKTDVKAQAKSKVQSAKQSALRRKQDVAVPAAVAGALVLCLLLYRRGRRD
jgi:hypothetical protein